MEIVMFNNSPEAVRAMKHKMRRYEEWCHSLRLDINDDENWISFCEWDGNR